MTSGSAASGLLAGKVAVVTGAARGIGLAVAARFAAHGATVALGDIDIAALKQAVRELERGGVAGRVAAVPLDVTDPASLEAAANLCFERFGRLDCAVANAGVIHLANVVDMELGAWRRVLDVNLTGAFLTCRTFARRLVEQDEGGRIILTSSLFGVRGGAENGAYSASKFGMLGLAQSLAAELAPHSVLVNSVCPGQVDSDLLRQLFQDRALLTGSSAEAVREALESRIPLGRIGEADEAADVYVFLASDLSRYVTGQHLVVDGGWTVG